MKPVTSLCLYAILVSILFAVFPSHPSYADAAKITTPINDFSVVEIFKKGKEFYLAQNYIDAEPLFQQCVKLEPKNAEYLSWLAQTIAFLLADQAMKGASNLTLLPEARKVRELYQKAIDADPKNERARLGYAIILRDIPGILGGSIKKAESILKGVIKDNPENIFALHHLGTLYIRKKNDCQKGLECLKKVIAISQKKVLSPEEKLRLGATYHALGKTYLEELNDASQAVPFLEKAAEMNEDSVLAFLDLAEAYRIEKQIAKAKDCLLKAVKISAAHEYKRFDDDIKSSAKKLNMKKELGLS
ncbi:MAG: tetratricopeptide repeat protein [Candidatus Omnitrophota bacterium]